MQTFLIFHGVFKEDSPFATTDFPDLSITKAFTIDEAKMNVLEEFYGEEARPFVEFTVDCRELAEGEVYMVEPEELGFGPIFDAPEEDNEEKENTYKKFVEIIDAWSVTKRTSQDLTEELMEKFQIIERWE